MADIFSCAFWNVGCSCLVGQDNLMVRFNYEEFRIVNKPCTVRTLAKAYYLHFANKCYDDVIKWKLFPRHWPCVRGIHRSPVNSPHNSQWRRALLFSLICAWINGWVNNREAGDLRRHRANYDVTVMHRCPSTKSYQWPQLDLKLSTQYFRQILATFFQWFYIDFIWYTLKRVACIIEKSMQTIL